MIFRSVAFSLSQRKFWKEVRRKRAEWESVAAKNESIVIDVSPGTQMKLYTGNELSSHIYCGAFEWEEREWLLQELKSGDVFYDIGANIGLFSLVAAGKCKSVVAFEPAKDTYHLLSENVLLNAARKNITLINAAASEKNGTQDIYVLTNGKDAWNSMAVKPEEGLYRIEQITTVCVDDMVNSSQIPPPDVIKIDVEGWEAHVLKGLEKTIERYRPTMLIEFTEANLKAAGSSVTELAGKIAAVNYSLFTYDARYRRLKPVSDFSFDHKNLIAKPNQ